MLYVLPPRNKNKKVVIVIISPSLFYRLHNEAAKQENEKNQSESESVREGFFEGESEEEKWEFPARRGAGPPVCPPRG